MFCNSCIEAASLTSKSLSDLDVMYQNARLLGDYKFSGSFEEYVGEIRRQTAHLHSRCPGDTHCVCQHHTESVIRDLT